MSRVLAINAGSSSVKFAVFAAEADPRELLRGHVDGTGADARLFVDGVEQDLAGGVALRPMPMIQESANLPPAFWVRQTPSGDQRGDIYISNDERRLPVQAVFANNAGDQSSAGLLIGRDPHAQKL